jgi:hypothetical protein
MPFFILSPAKFRPGADCVPSLHVNFIAQNRQPCKDNSWVLAWGCVLSGPAKHPQERFFKGQSPLAETGAPEYDWAQMNKLKGLCLKRAE